MAKKKKRFQFQLGLPGLIFSLGLLVCLFLWMFVLGFYFGQRMVSSRIEKMESPVSRGALARKTAPKAPPPVFETVKPPALVGEELSGARPEREAKKEAPAQAEEKPVSTAKGQASGAQRAAKAAGAKEPSPGKEPPRKRPPARKASRPAGPFYSVQVASFRVAAEAESYVERLRARGYEAFVRRVNLPRKGVWYRVYVGRFKTLAEARRFGEELKKREKLRAFYVQKLGSSS